MQNERLEDAGALGRSNELYVSRMTEGLRMSKRTIKLITERVTQCMSGGCNNMAKFVVIWLNSPSCVDWGSKACWVKLPLVYM